MGVSVDDTDWGSSNDEALEQHRLPKSGENMKSIKHIAPWLAATAIGATLVFAPVASAVPGHVAPLPSPGMQSESGASPDVPFGPNAPGDEVPYNPYIKNPGGGVDLPS
jgi:hypothetical protein